MSFYDEHKIATLFRLVDISAMRADFLYQILPTDYREDDTRNAEKWEVVLDFCLHNFVAFRYISTKHGIEVYVFSFNSPVKFNAKIFTRC